MDRRAAILLTAVSLAVGAFAGTSLGGVSVAAAACPRVQPKAAGPTSAIVRGRGLAAAVGRSIVVIGGAERRQAFVAPSPGDTVVRHVASGRGRGTAYVEDRPGPDVVVIVGARGIVRLPQSSEAMHPGWSADGRLVWSTGSELRVWPGAGRGTSSIPSPRGATGVFSPVFTAEDRITAVVSMPAPGAVTEDESSNDLWTYDLPTGAWSRRTRFPSRADRWTAIRTPVLGSDGGLEFVVVTGDASATAQPASALWRLSGARATKVRDLPREMYLAGTMDGRRVWNVFDRGLGDWRLSVEDGRGGFTDLGCGRVMVDPLAEPDPDRGQAAQGSPTPTPEPTSSPTPTTTPTDTPTAAPTAIPSPGSIVSPTEAILVGDFATFDEAANVGLAISTSLGDGTTTSVIDSTIAPAVIMPGVWAVVMPIPADQDSVSALLAFRERLPQYAGSSWVVSL